jgi:hypothetical protein
LFCAESKLVIVTLALGSTIYQIFESHLLILNPSVRQYCLRRDRVIADEVSCQAELACVVALQQTRTVSPRKVKATAAAAAAVHQSRYIYRMQKSVDFLGGTSTFALRAAMVLQKSTTYIATTTQDNQII